MNGLISLCGDGRYCFFQAAATAGHGAHQHADQGFVNRRVFRERVKRTFASHGVVPHAKWKGLVAEFSGGEELGC